MTHAPSIDAPLQSTDPAPAPGAAPAHRPPAASKVKISASATQAVLEQLAAHYPALFGAEFRPLKRGIFQDIHAAHPEAFPKDALKAALAWHARSTRYLVAVSSGRQRFDLDGAAVEDLAPEHIYLALTEVFRRRQARTPQDDLRPKLQARMVQAFEASGMSREDYAALVHGRDEAINALLDEALVHAGERAAKREALQRAFAASGATSQAFAEMYGLDPREVARLIQPA